MNNNPPAAPRAGRIGVPVPRRLKPPPERKAAAAKVPRSPSHRTATWSVFLVTINSNKVPLDMQAHEDLLVELARLATEAVFNEQNIPNLVAFRPGWEGDSYAVNVASYRFSGNVEIGSRRNFAVHSHTTLAFKHDSSIMLDRNALAEQFAAVWNSLAPNNPQTRILTRPYVNIQAAPHNVANWLLYQQKDADTLPTQSSQGDALWTGL